MDKIRTVLSELFLSYLSFFNNGNKAFVFA